VTSLDRREVLGHTEVLGSEDEYDCYLEDASYDENGSYDEQHSAYGNESSEEEEYETDDADSSSYFSAVHPTDHILEMCKNRHSNSMNGSSFRQKSYSSSDDNSDTPSYQRALRASNANGGASYAHHPTHYMGSMYQSAATHSHQQALVDYEYSSEEDDPEGMVDEARSIAIALTQQRGGEIYNHKESANFEHGNDDGYILYNERWVMLFWMSLLNLLSDWTCYSIAPIEAFVSGKYPTSYSKELLVTLFLTANAIASLCEPAILTRIGLRRTVLLGSILLCIGSILKGQIFGVLGGIHEDSVDWKLPSAFIITGLSQPLYQCTPAVLSNTYFADSERTMATGVALNSNQIGIGLSFFFGALLIREEDSVPWYFSFLSYFSSILVIGVLIWFKDGPDSPPSSSAKVIRGSWYKKKNDNEGDDETAAELGVIDQVKHCFAIQGFSHALVAFTASAIVINTLSTNFEALLLTARPSDDTRDDISTDVAIFGGGFQLIVMSASLVMGGSADTTRAYFSVILALLILGAFNLAECGIALDPNNTGALSEKYLLLICAFFVGPLQPVSTELGVDVVYPDANENTVLVIQQLFANGCSSIFIPIFASCKYLGITSDLNDDEHTLVVDSTGVVDDDAAQIDRGTVPQYYYSFYLLVLVHAATTAYFSTFRGKYRRYEDEVAKQQEKQKQFGSSHHSGNEQTPYLPDDFGLGNYYNAEGNNEMIGNGLMGYNRSSPYSGEDSHLLHSDADNREYTYYGIGHQRNSYIV